MALVSSACFPGLSREEREAQLYEALGGTDCFSGLSPEERRFKLYQALGGTACFLGLSLSEQRAAIYLAAGGTEGCFSGRTHDEQEQLLYARFYDLAGDTDLVDPACFLGLSPAGREAALFAAIAGSPVGQFFFDSTIITWDSTIISLDAA